MNVVVIGASRGIGLGFAEQYLEKGCSVVATYRKAIPVALAILQEKYPKALTLHPLEITDPKSIEEFAETLKLAETSKKVNILILSAGIKGYSVPFTRPLNNTYEEGMKAMAVNYHGHDNIIRALYPLLVEQRNACVVYMGSKVGQTADNGSGGSHPYRNSKAAAHGMIWNWNIELMQDWKKAHEDDLAHTPCAVAICPGWVKTDMGGEAARLTVEESVSKMRGVIQRVIETKASNGLLMYDGTTAEKYVTPTILEEVIKAKKSK